MKANLMTMALLSAVAAHDIEVIQRERSDRNDGPVALLRRLFGDEAVDAATGGDCNSCRDLTLAAEIAQCVAASATSLAEHLSGARCMALELEEFKEEARNQWVGSFLALLSVGRLLGLDMATELQNQYNDLRAKKGDDVRILDDGTLRVAKNVCRTTPTDSVTEAVEAGRAQAAPNPVPVAENELSDRIDD